MEGGRRVGGGGGGDGELVRGYQGWFAFGMRLCEFGVGWILMSMAFFMLMDGRF